MHFDAVFWGAILSVLLALVILIFLVYRVVKLMNRDAEAHKVEQ
jgi:4-amino-4-deoxy-L-arabinose transferase-like glycosyltransferase